ncbi:putative 26S proteasome regulatory subunit [Coemansia sp. RSA 2049]|nr:putative 26S proteasome regulatory subunit [Coemansia sp. RSA 2049]KAJ2519976.1 putative 26S proteasome regulatory subunit [Coemansia sp. RSA 1939]KAJ2615039.1 putative 26S proteasome regulatory subunit [Coemansia sp. RSA 1804]
MEHAQDLLKQKDALENEIRELELDLRSHGVTKTEALVDSEGFPRSDVDIGTVREIRRSLVYKQNDLKELMRQIEHSLAVLHKDASQDKGEMDLKAETPTLQRPFARVGKVALNSPASDAGLAVGDMIVTYGLVNERNHDNLRQLVTETAENVLKPIEVLVSRVINGQPQTKTLVLTPRRDWGGDGVLGCYIVPL